MAEFIKGRALSEDSAPLAYRLRRFILVLSQVFRQARPDGRRLFLFPHRAKPRAAVPDRKHRRRRTTALGWLMKQVVFLFLDRLLPALCTVQTVYSGAAMQIDE
mgnify:CR=1 FL=1